MSKNKLVNWRLETAVLAHEMIEGDPHARRDDEAELAEALQAIIIAYVIVHRRRPTPADVTGTLSEYDGDQTLVGRAVRTACDREELAAAKRCDAWRKANEKSDRAHAGYRRRQAADWCQKHAERAGSQLKLLEGDERGAAVARLGWELHAGAGAPAERTADDGRGDSKQPDGA